MPKIYWWIVERRRRRRSVCIIAMLFSADTLKIYKKNNNESIFRHFLWSSQVNVTYFDTLLMYMCVCVWSNYDWFANFLLIIYFLLNKVKYLWKSEKEISLNVTGCTFEKEGICLRA